MNVIESPNVGFFFEKVGRELRRLDAKSVWQEEMTTEYLLGSSADSIGLHVRMMTAIIVCWLWTQWLIKGNVPVSNTEFIFPAPL